MAKEIPQLDLPQLEPFFRNAAKTHGRRVTTSEAGLSIATPEIWRNDLDLKSRYDGLTFDRDLAPQEQMNRMMGIGHSLVDKLLEHAVNQPVFAAYLKGLENPILLARVEDELTGTKATVHRIVLGLQYGQSNILRDGELLTLLNRCIWEGSAPNPPFQRACRDLARTVDPARSDRTPSVVRLHLPKGTGHHGTGTCAVSATPTVAARLAPPARFWRELLRHVHSDVVCDVS